jgi:hypothetical protein
MLNTYPASYDFHAGKRTKHVRYAAKLACCATLFATINSMAAMKAIAGNGSYIINVWKGSLWNRT